jgi:hypothetical protein
MILWSNIAISKEVLWDHVAREFDYYCQVCGERPGFKDSHIFLSGGRCRACCESKPGTMNGEAVVVT